MGYREAMELAGAKILAYDSFGDYQGTWWAKVEFEGQIGWAFGYYGSCSGCDAFESEFDYVGHDHDDGYVSHYYPEKWLPNCPQCVNLADRMVAFGRGYLEDLITQEDAERRASKNLEWDMEAKTTVAWLERNR